jgi:ribose transport system ATP-binding protein/rhamnose transport system ATP-binding protein
MMGTRVIAETTADELIQLEVGRELTFARDDRRPLSDAPVVLDVQGLAADPVTEATFQVRAGEIVCLAGLVGAGRTELCEAVFGARVRQSGRVSLLGHPLHAHHPIDAMRAGIGMVPEDRRDAGLFLAMGVDDNILAGNLDSVTRVGVLQPRKIADLARRYIESLRIATPSADREVVFLSGGNQQKVLLARWLERAPKLLIVDEPTRGVDVGAKAEVYQILRQLAQNGVALLVVSSDLPEVLALAHRIVVMSEGRTVATLDAADATEVSVLQRAMPRGAAHGEG